MTKDTDQDKVKGSQPEDALKRKDACDACRNVVLRMKGQHKKVCSLSLIRFFTQINNKIIFS